MIPAAARSELYNQGKLLRKIPRIRNPVFRLFRCGMACARTLRRRWWRGLALACCLLAVAPHAWAQQALRLGDLKKAILLDNLKEIEAAVKVLENNDLLPALMLDD